MITLQGKIGNIYLSSVLQLLCNDKKTGVLRVWQHTQEVTIYLHEGTIVYAKSSEKEHRLGYLLQKTGLISPYDLRTSLDVSIQRKQTLGKTMVEMGFISIETLTKFMYMKVQNTLYNLFLWETGIFEFRETSLNLQGHVIVELHTMELILEASRRADEKSALKQKDAAADEGASSPGDKTITFFPPDDEQ